MCRQSIGRLTTVAPPYLSFLRKTSLTGISNFFSTAQESPEASDHDSLLSKPLLSETSIDKEVLTSVPPVKISASAFSKFSTRKSPPPQEQCSLAQAVINGKKGFSPHYFTILFIIFFQKKFFQCQILELLEPPHCQSISMENYAEL